MADNPWVVNYAYRWYNGGSNPNSGFPILNIAGMEPQYGDVIIYHTWMYVFSYQTLTPPTGMTQVGGVYNNAMQHNIFWYRHGIGTQPTGYITHSATGIQRGESVYVIRGCVQTGTPFESGTFLSTHPNQTTHNISAMTSGGTNRTAIDFCCHMTNSTANDNATNYSEVLDYNFYALYTFGMGQACYEYPVSSSGSVAADSYTWTTAARDGGWCACFIGDDDETPNYKCRRPTINSGGSSVTVNLPNLPPPKAGDLMVITTWCKSTSYTCTTPSGWTKLSGPDDVGSGLRAYVFAKIAAGGETSQAIVWSGYTYPLYKYAHSFLVEKVNSTTFTDDVQVNLYSTATANYAVPAMTSAGGWRLAFGIGVLTNGNGRCNDNATYYSEKYEQYIGTPYPGVDTFGLGDRKITSSGSVSSDSFTINSSYTGLCYGILWKPINDPVSGYGNKPDGVLGSNVGKINGVTATAGMKFIGA